MMNDQADLSENQESQVDFLARAVRNLEKPSFSKPFKPRPLEIQILAADCAEEHAELLLKDFSSTSGLSCSLHELFLKASQAYRFAS